MSLTSPLMPLRTRLFASAYDRTGALDVSSLTLEQIRAARGRVAPTRAPFTWVTGAVPRGVQISSAGFTARDGHEIGVRAYRPRSVTGPLPVVVFFHGGGWVLGSVLGYDPLCGFIADAVPALVLSIDYRMAPEHPAPQAGDDCVDAVRWVGTGAGALRDLGADPSRIAVSGDSAGGNLAAVVSQVIRDEGGPRIAHQALLYPGTDATRSHPSIRQHANAPVLTRRAIDAFLELYAMPSGLPLDDPLISPLFAPDVTNLPATLVQTADLDPLRDEGQAYAARLRAAGVPTRSTNYLRAPHGFMSFPGATVVGPQARLELVSELGHHLAAVPDDTTQAGVAGEADDR